MLAGLAQCQFGLPAAAMLHCVLGQSHIDLLALEMLGLLLQLLLLLHKLLLLQLLLLLVHHGLHSLLHAQ